MLLLPWICLSFSFFFRHAVTCPNRLGRKHVFYLLLGEGGVDFVNKTWEHGILKNLHEMIHLEEEYFRPKVLLGHKV
jgi:hypothetical protein